MLISHRMPDVFAVADRIIVLRRGAKVADKPIAATSPEEVTGLITGAIASGLKRTMNDSTSSDLQRAIDTRSHAGSQQVVEPAGVLGARRRAARRLVLTVVRDRHVRHPAEPVQRDAQLRLRRPSSRIGMTVVIITGGIDLSVGSILCLSAMVPASC